MKTKKKFGMRRHIGITAAATLIALGATACEEAYWGKTDGESNKKIYDDFVDQQIFRKKEEFIEYAYKGDTISSEDGTETITGNAKPETKIVIIYRELN